MRRRLFSHVQKLSLDTLDRRRLGDVIARLTGDVQATGETLSHMVAVRDVRLSAAEVAHPGLHLASAVRYLHGHGWLHLDLKPSNVIAECGRAKLIDLGVACPPGPAHRGVGTFRYMAPEQARSGDLGAPADIWRLGAVLFEAATGEPSSTTPTRTSSTATSPTPRATSPTRTATTGPPMRASTRMCRRGRGGPTSCVPCLPSWLT
jgi:serine/threonine protein kinase